MEIIKGENIILRPIGALDTGDIVRWRNSARVKANFVYREDFTPESHAKWLKEEIESGNSLQWVICVPAGASEETADTDTTGIGSVFVKNIHDEVPEYGIFIGEDSALNKGYASEAARLVTDHCRGKKLCKKLGLRVYMDNLPAIKSYESAGFRQVKTLPRVVSSDGSVDDMIWMEITL